eukprot:GFKZ01004935.1.p1 GENE.GFKZ01004935.1~~GFKZ01004935.1.p1  ORF type:complete len:508 (-),score=101.15 GFKZ01004935.1:1358-2857(-)
MDIPSELIAQFIGVTNASESLAQQLLHDSQLNLEDAISSFFAIQEAGGLPHDAPAASSPPDPTARLPDSPPTPAPSNPDAVRAPIPQTVDTLLPQLHRPSRPVAPPPDPFANSDGSRRADGLANLFRHPTHLNFSDSFENAMTAGVRQNKWLLVNIQRSDIFACLMLNRDVWADEHVEEVLQAHFIFWQRDETTPDAERFKRFYWYAQPPYVALIDPRSGERLVTWGGDGEEISKSRLLSGLVDFIEMNSLDSDPAVRPSAASGARARRAVPHDSYDADDGSEDAILAAAIAASMEQSGRVRAENHGAAASSSAAGRAENGLGAALGRASLDVNRSQEREASRVMSAADPALNRNRSLRAQQDNEFEESLAMDRAIEQSKKEEATRKEMAIREEERRVRDLAAQRKMKRRRVPPVPPLDCKEKITELAVRLPTGARLQRRFLASDTVGNVYDFIQSEVEEMIDVDFELMTAFPKKSYTDREANLEELAPKAALVVHLKE